MPAPPTPAAKDSNKRSNGRPLHNQQDSREKGSGGLVSQERYDRNYGAGRQDVGEESVVRIYPRELTKSPSNAARHGYPASPPLKPYSPLPSPLLPAFGLANNAAAYNTSEWTKSLPLFHKQAIPNEMSLNGSPPNIIPSRTPLSGSPPAHAARSASHPNQYSSVGERLHQSPVGSPRGNRRASMLSNLSQRPAFGGHAPLPHEPQPHFYGAPTLDFGVPNASKARIRPGENGYFCGFDTLENAGDERSTCALNVLLVGSEGSLDVFWVEREKTDQVGSLKGLKGSVIGAKILPWTARDDPYASKRPLVALIIHAPVVSVKNGGADQDNSLSAIFTDRHAGSSESPTRSPSREANNPCSEITHYQTTVEVYSLAEKQHIATLYTTPSVALQHLIGSPLFSRPPPVGDLTVDANGKFVVVASGYSGELFIFSPVKGAEEKGPEEFRCICKVWTTVNSRQARAASSASSTTDTNSPNGESRPAHGVPLYSLSHRWLAVVPPSTSSLLPLNGTTLLPGTEFKPPGIHTHTAPPQPMVSCAVDVPETESRLNDVAREVAQGAIKGARWVSDQGIQAFKSYWGKPSSPVGQFETQPQQYFPPTHGHTVSSPQSGSEPILVSIIDLQRLLDAQVNKNKNALEPIATFVAPQGCQYVAFAPAGLSLMTVNRRGDVQYVWDLKRIRDGKAGQAASNVTSSSHVRQIAKFTRMTEANVVDVVWSATKEDRLAILTEKGTIHIHELPASAFHWPPLRRARKAVQPVKEPNSENPQDKTATKGWMSAVSSGMQAVNGTLAAARSRSASQGSRFPLPTLSGLSITPAVGAKGGKAVAAGLKHSIGAATDSVNQVWHARDNKLNVHSLATGVLPGRMRWLTGKERGCIAVVAGGSVHLYPVKRSTVTTTGKKSVTTLVVAKDKAIAFELPGIPDLALPPGLLNPADADTAKPDDDTATTLHGIWNLRGPTATAARLSEPPFLSHAEIDTNPPYQPFHTDRRVNLFAYTAPPAPASSNARDDDGGAGAPAPAATTAIAMSRSQSDPHHVDDTSPWVFGGEIPATRILVGAVADEDEDGEKGMGTVEGGVEVGVESLVQEKRGEGEVERIVVTTRRRGRRQWEETEEGIFEDDCEVLEWAGDRV